MWVAVGGQTGSTNFIATSTDGINWSEINANSICYFLLNCETLSIKVIRISAANVFYYFKK